MQALTLGMFLLLSASGMLQADESRQSRWAMELLQADREFASLSESTNPKTAFSAYLAPNALMLPSSGDPLDGFDASIASFGEEPKFGLHWQPQLAEVAESGEMGWTWGTYQVLVDGKQMSNGKYVNIWMRQPDGRWKVRLDLGNQEPAQEESSDKP